MADVKKPVVVLGIPCGPTISFGFLQAIVRALLDPGMEIRPLPIGNTVVHLARDQLIKAALEVRDVTHLVMVDSDQVWHHGTIRRLVEWDVPVVAPVVVQRNGEAIPVAYREVAQDDKGYWRYEPLVQEVAMYLRRYSPEKWSNGAGVALLPPEPDYPDPQVDGLPDDLRAGLDFPLFPVDALGTGMICFRRDVLEAMRPDPRTGLYCDFQHGGEDFSLSRKVREAGWRGLSAPSMAHGDKGYGLYVDRGALVGHLTQYSRGAGDLLAYYESWAAQRAQEEAGEADLPPAVPDLVEKLQARNSPLNGQPEWMKTRLPGEVEGAPV